MSSSEKKDKGSPLLRGAVLPAAVVAGGLATGSLAGAYAPRYIAKIPRVAEYLRHASEADKAKILKRLKWGTGTLGTAAGGALAAGLNYQIEKEIDKKRKAEKTAMFMACMRHIGEM